MIEYRVIDRQHPAPAWRPVFHSETKPDCVIGADKIGCILHNRLPRQLLCISRIDEIVNGQHMGRIAEILGLPGDGNAINGIIEHDWRERMRGTDANLHYANDEKKHAGYIFHYEGTANWQNMTHQWTHRQAEKGHRNGTRPDQTLLNPYSAFMHLQYGPESPAHNAAFVSVPSTGRLA
ncbi:MAG TPA: hypothetical protein PLE73_06245 [Spirochaetota bacterium]|nr:hypothetical protein [Spirochaetota bacterium]HPI22779.1 hypothetical protein [Spirochaetota bacterium]HPU90381.1 hypothetical protein [Spirochaetota bacterium]